MADKKDELIITTVFLSASQGEFVRERAAAIGCSGPSEYIRRLIDADRALHQQTTLELKIVEGLDSPSREMISADWASLRDSLRGQLAKCRKAQ